MCREIFLFMTTSPTPQPSPCQTCLLTTKYILFNTWGCNPHPYLSQHKSRHKSPMLPWGCCRSAVCTSLGRGIRPVHKYAPATPYHHGSREWVSYGSLNWLGLCHHLQMMCTSKMLCSVLSSSKTGHELTSQFHHLLYFLWILTSNIPTIYYVLSMPVSVHV